MQSDALKIKPSDGVSLETIEGAARRLAGAVLRTPVLEAPKLSALSGARVFIKYENLQATGSFKERGALLKLLSLNEAERSRGVIAISAGNHAQAVAYHAARLGIPATVVMPETTPFTKVTNTEACGATVILAGETVAESAGVADRMIAREGLTLIHPYDDPIVIAGQGTAGIEFIEDCPSLDALIVPVGGGGLIAGVASAVLALKPGVEIVGVEVDSYPAVHAALYGASKPFGRATLADGIAVKGLGRYTFPLIRKLVSDVVLVTETAVEEAIFAFASLQKTVAEGASAAGLAALLAYRERFHGRNVGLLHTGANIDPRVLSSILVRGLERDGKIVALRLSIPDRPGMLGEIASELGRCGVNILEVDHRRFYLNVPAKGAVVEIVIETKNLDHARKAVERLRSHGFEVTWIGNGTTFSASDTARDLGGGETVAPVDKFI